MFVRPLTDRLVRDPLTREPLPQSGAEVPLSSFWRRRERCGDVEVVKPPGAAKAKPKALPEKKRS